MENRKSTILLTVIAVATLLVAVVGATFAYFTAQGGTAASSQVNVVTYKTASGSFTITNDSLSISANQQNFAENGYSHEKTTDATVRFTGATTSDTGNTTDFCYRVGLKVESNDFTSLAATNEGIMLVNASENGLGAFGAGDALTGESGSATYRTGTNGYNAVADVGDPGEVTAGQLTTFDGFDIMGLATGTYYFEKASGMTDAGSVKVYKLTSTNGAEVTNNWDFSLTFVNTNKDQNPLTGTNGLRFNSKIEFTQVSCTDGSVMAGNPGSD